MNQISDVAIVYRPAEDGDMIQFGPNCALSLEKVRGLVRESGPIVRGNFEKWLDDLKAQACADAFKPLADVAREGLQKIEWDPAIQLLTEIRDSMAEMSQTLNDVTANRRQFHTSRGK
jgi:hypothetical protein